MQMFDFEAGLCCNLLTTSGAWGAIIEIASLGKEAIPEEAQATDALSTTVAATPFMAK